VVANILLRCKCQCTLCWLFACSLLLNNIDHAFFMPFTFGNFFDKLQWNCWTGGCHQGNNERESDSQRHVLYHINDHDKIHLKFHHRNHWQMD
jgi:hypothetical protein